MGKSAYQSRDFRQIDIARNSAQDGAASSNPTGAASRHEAVEDNLTLNKEAAYYYAPPSKSKEVLFKDLNDSVEALKSHIEKMNPTLNPELGDLIQKVDTNTIAFGGSVGCTFTLFSRLPIELRLRIWALAAYQPRVVNVHTRHLAGQIHTRRLSGQTFFYARNI